MRPRTDRTHPSRVRSRALLALSLALLATSGALAYVLRHDAVGESAPLAQVTAGEDVTVKGAAHPFVPRAYSAREAAAWVEIEGQFENVTVQLDTGEPGMLVLVTGLSSAPAPGSTLVASGPILLRAPHPDGTARTVLLVRATAAESPILFR